MPIWFMVRVAGLITATALLALCTGSRAQTVERRLYTVSEGLRQDLDAHGIDSGQYAAVVNGVAEGVATGDLAPLLAQAAPTLRVTTSDANVTLPKDGLGKYAGMLLKTPNLGRDIVDDDQVIIHDGQVGLARGTIWIRQECLDGACSKKKSQIVTINLP